MRNERFFQWMYRNVWPAMRAVFRIKIQGAAEIPKGPILLVSNHNIGALIESHALVFLLEDLKRKNSDYRPVVGFTHPFIFKIPLMSLYFRSLGAIPATPEAAAEAFAAGYSILIFPGGNRQAVRSVWRYAENSFRWTHGWAKIAIQHRVPVVPVAYRGTQFVNPVLISSAFLARSAKG